MGRTVRPDIGTKMYSVHEHHYYIKEHPAPLREYCVCEAEVIDFIQGGYTEVELRGKSPGGFMTPYRYRLSDIGKRIFYTPREAALLAKDMTEQYEKTWGRIGSPETPMRRPWEKYLDTSGEIVGTDKERP